jgi:1,4-dihydroxy-2-naphthoate octaprenyltransferase
MKTTGKALLKLARPHLFTGTLILYFTGSFFAALVGYPFDVLRFLLGLGIVAAALLSMSYGNNYFDAEVDKLTTPTSFSGGGGTLLQDNTLRSLAKRISIGSFSLSLALAVIFIILFSFPLEFFLYVLAGNVMAWFYTAPPLKFSYHGLGELATMVAIGLMIPGLGYYVLARTIDLSLVLLTVPLMLYMAVFIISAEIPDRQGDTLGKKKTFVVRTSTLTGYFANTMLALIAAVYFFVLAFTKVLSVPVDFFILAVLSLIPFAFGMMSLLRYSKTSQISFKNINANVSSIVVFILFITVYLGVLVFF